MTMTFKQSYAIWEILVKHVGAHDSESERLAFAETQFMGCVEYRFQGSLGFGGKFWNYDGRWYVTCYPESETPERLAAMAKANAELAAFHQR